MGTSSSPLDKSMPRDCEIVSLFTSPPSSHRKARRGASSASTDPFEIASKDPSPFIEDANLLMNDAASDWRFFSEACPRSRWTPDSKTDRCEFRGCLVRFGSFGMPGVSFAYGQRRSTSSLDVFSADNSLTGKLMLTLPANSAVMPPRRASSASTFSSVDSPLSSQVNAWQGETLSTAVPIIQENAKLVRSYSAEHRTISPASAHNNFFRTFSITTDSEDNSFRYSSVTAPPTPTLCHSQSSSIRSSSLESIMLGEPAKQRTNSSLAMVPRSPVKVHRRHHCRRCGACFCSEHSSNVVTLILSEEDRTAAIAESNESSDEDNASELDEQTTSSEKRMKHAEIVGVFGKPRRCARNALQEILDQNDAVPWISGKAIATPVYQRRFIRARVCDDCFTLCQRARARYNNARRRREVFSTNTTMENVERENAEVQSLFSVDLTEPVIPTEREEEVEEYFASKQRIWAEKKREHKELLKSLCNLPTANRIVAAAASVNGQEKPRLVPSGACTPVRKYSVQDALAGLDDDLSSLTQWEKVEIGRHNEKIAKVAMSLDSVMLRASEDKRPHHHQATSVESNDRTSNLMTFVSDQLVATPTTASMHPEHRTLSEEDDEIDQAICRDLMRLGSPAGWERRWTSRPSSPHPLLQGGCTWKATSPSLSGVMTPQASSFFDSAGVSIARGSSTTCAMGGRRLQRSFLSHRSEPAVSLHDAIAKQGSK